MALLTIAYLSKKRRRKTATFISNKKTEINSVLKYDQNIVRIYLKIKKNFSSNVDINNERKDLWKTIDMDANKLLKLLEFCEKIDLEIYGYILVKYFYLLFNSGIRYDILQKLKNPEDIKIGKYNFLEFMRIQILSGDFYYPCISTENYFRNEHIMSIESLHYNDMKHLNYEEEIMIYTIDNTYLKNNIEWKKVDEKIFKYLFLNDYNCFLNYCCRNKIIDIQEEFVKKMNINKEIVKYMDRTYCVVIEDERYDIITITNKDEKIVEHISLI